MTGSLNEDSKNINQKGSSSGSDFIFPEWANYVPFAIAVSVFLLLVGLIFIFWFWFSPKNLNVGYAPEQPIPYSHRLHAGELGIDCRYCHVNVDKGENATIPPTELCLNCHNVVKKDSPHIQKLRESYVSGKPIEWVKVHMLPDYVYFNHSRHVNSGVSCVSCHGRVDKMEVVHQVESMSMSWCLDCHRNPEKHIRYKDKVTDLAWVSDEDPVTLGRRLKKLYHVSPSEDCSACHR